MRLLYLSGAKSFIRHKIDPFRDPSFIYRIHNPAISAVELGHKVGIKHLLDLSNPFIDKGWDAAIIHRPSLNSTFINAVKILKKNKIPIFGDFDDLIFSMQHASDRPSVKIGIETLEQSINRIQKHLLAIEHINGVITSNSFLADIISKISNPPKNIIVMNNSWHFSWIKKNQINQASMRIFDRRQLQLNYFSGTRTHDLDLALIAQPLVKILNKHKHTVFVFVGKGNLPNKLNLKALRQKKIHFSNYHNAVSKAFINLAPLESTTFNQAKSALKIIEAGFFGIQTICSPTPEYRDAPEISRKIASSIDEWESGLDEAIGIGYNSDIINNRLREVRHHYHPLKTTKKMISSFESILK